MRQSLVDDPSLVATGLLSLTAGSGEAGIAVGDNRVVQKLATLTEQSLDFGAVGGLPAGTFTLGEYAGAITGLNAVQAADAAERAELNRNMFDNLEHRHTSATGVNVDEEMANILVFQNAFGAAARVMGTIDEMLDLLMEITA